MEKQLRMLEKAKAWDVAIDFMKDAIHKNPGDMETYLFMNYLLMNYLVEEDHTAVRYTFNQCWKLCKKYFKQAYTKFSDNAEFLYYTGKTAVMLEWFFGIDIAEAE